MEDLLATAYQKWQKALEADDFEGAQRYYRVLCGSLKEPPEVSFIMGLWQRQNGLYEQALSAFREALTINPAVSAEIYYEMGNTYMEMAQDEEAAHAYEQALAIDDTLAECHFCYGQLLSKQGKKEAAKRQFCHVLQIDNQAVETFINVAVALSELGLGDEATWVYWQALFLEPENYYLYSNLGVEFAEMHDFASALFCHYKGLSLNDKAADLWYNLACTYSLMNEVTNGLDALEKAIVLDDDNALYAQEDPELVNLRRNSRFYQLLNLPLGR